MSVKAGNGTGVSKALWRAEKALYYLQAGVISLCLVALVVLLFGQIVGRQFRQEWMAPPDEIVTLFFTWLVFIGAAVLERDAKHLRVELLDGWLRKRPRLAKLHSVVTDLLVLGFLIVTIRSGLALYQLAGLKTSPTLQWSQQAWYLPLPICGCLMALYVEIGRASCRERV